MGTNLETGLDVNREFKDTVFSLLLNGDTESARLIANSFSGTNYPEGTEVVFKTLQNVFTKGRINDLAFILDNRLIVLVEAQSTLNENMPYRMLQYIAETYKKLHATRDEYREKMFTLQRPKFIVFYSGDKEMKEDVLTLRLSDMFAPYGPAGAGADDGSVDLELTVKMYNINRGRNVDKLKSCETLRHYSIFIGMVHEYRRAMPLEQAIKQAVVDCIGQNVLKAFLLKHEGELVNMLVSEWNMETALEVREEEGRMEEKREIARRMKAKGKSVEEIEEMTGLTVDDILRL
ncbi:MAG: hypothetical protein FWB85_09080 [Chitinispirillia bacterium]|nr:hypothetical protein [Chitinispirillia bacterium]MCL2242356.1 hypothetical protein [Chitinispirillia bacterium]